MLQKLINEALDNITPEKWSNACQHVRRLEDTYRKRENILPRVPQVVISLESDNDEDVYTADDEDGDDFL